MPIIFSGREKLRIGNAEIDEEVMADSTDIT